jgi:hypothetical protein
MVVNSGGFGLTTLRYKRVVTVQCKVVLCRKCWILSISDPEKNFLHPKVGSADPYSQHCIHLKLFTFSARSRLVRETCFHNIEII